MADNNKKTRKPRRPDDTPRWPEGRPVLIQHGNEIKPLGRSWGGGRETTIYNASEEVAKQLDTAA